MKKKSKTRKLYWTTIELYLACPQKYLWSRGHKDIDVGGGPGKKKPLKVLRSEHDKLMGHVLSKCIEHLYNDELWKEPTTTLKKLMGLVEREFKLALSDHYIDWKESPPKEALLQTCKDGIQGFIKTMKANKLVGFYARSEVDLVAKSKSDDLFMLGGRPDIVIQREDNGVTIIDGKNSKTPGKYTDPNQLRWYAFCYYLVHGVIPDNLYFCYFRYPPGNPHKDHKGDWKGLTKVEVTKEDFELLDHMARKTILGIASKSFDPTPKPSVCRFCDYEPECEARQSTKRSRRKTTKPPILSGSGGFEILEE